MIKQTKYYNLNIKLSSEIKTDKPDLFDATYNLEKWSRAPIFFGPYKPEQYIDAYDKKEKLEGLNKKQLHEAYNFIQLYKKDPEARLITIDEKIWIYKIVNINIRSQLQFYYYYLKDNKYDIYQYQFTPLLTGLEKCFSKIQSLDSTTSYEQQRAIKP